MIRRLIPSPNRFARCFTAKTGGKPAAKPPTAVLMMNMGGPSTQEEVQPFLSNLFGDPDIIKLGPFQKWLGPYMGKRRAPGVAKQYAAIGGGSPIAQWTKEQGLGMEKLLDKMSPETAPHKHYIGFRYAAPFTKSALQEMKEDGVTRAVAFSQYPHFSCTTTGSSLNNLWAELKDAELEQAFKWSLIDRWPTQPTFIKAVAQNVKTALEKYFSDIKSAEALKAAINGNSMDLETPIILFSAHSLPQYVVERGDTYSHEIAATVDAVMNELGMSNPFMLVWQSKVGPLPWIAPRTGDVLENLGKRGHKNVLVVPIAFTSDHVETLYEVDIEYAEIAEKAGIERFHRAEALNAGETFIQAQAEIVASHLKNEEVCSIRYKTRCQNCVNENCRKITNPITA